jgi:hypothetical protein
VCEFLWAKGLNAQDIKQEMSPVYDGKCLSHEAVHESRNSLKGEEVETEARKWLRQKSIRLLCCGFRRTGKAMGQVYQC